MAKGKSKVDQRAATRGGGFTGLPHVVQDSAAYASLSLYARNVLLCLLRRFNGYNNGSIAMSQREIGAAIGSTNFRKIGQAVADLMDRGLVDVRMSGDWKARQAREYRMTFISTGDGNRHVQATEDYRNWSPRAFSGADDASAGKGVSADDASAGPLNPADDASASRIVKWRKRVDLEIVAADDASSLICKPYPPTNNEANAAWSMWWRGDADLRLFAKLIGFVVATQPQLAAAA